MSSRRDIDLRWSSISEADSFSSSLPICSRLKTGELYCANCERTVVLVRPDEEAQQALEVVQLREVRCIVFDKATSTVPQAGQVYGVRALTSWAIFFTTSLLTT